MKLTDYYKMVKLPTCKSKLRFDCVASTGGYEPFEERAARGRDKRFKFYYGGTPDTFTANAQRKADRVITDTTSISSVFTPDLDNPLLGYGDTVGTGDALLFLFSEDYRQIEIFVARGLKNHAKGLFALFVDGELADEMECLRQQAKPTNAPTV
ncbi:MULTISPECIES: hypothetical protein [Bacteroidales]|uniref:hypothetical protein n=1 Tax=Bacteroidales TaxID=171549 RepID=UPI0026586241|nr:hypothetical protein [Bacteroides intestinalis]